MSTRAYSASESDLSESSENTYCIFLHIVEGIGLTAKDGTTGDSGGDRVKGKIVLNASLNGVKFEVEGHCTETSTIFNSNCIWECELGDIKRMKTDNRPVKLECFVKPGHAENLPRKQIGSLLLPMRGLQTISNIRNLQLKLHWHKLGTLSTEWRQFKPEIYLLLIIVKKTFVENGQLESLLGQKKNLPCDLLSPQTSETALMLQSKSNIYVQLLEQIGLIQVGNNPDVDCDIFNVSLIFKQVKNVERLLERERNFRNLPAQVFVFHYDFLGSGSHLEIFVNSSDCYTINEKITLSFKSSLKSLREYFQRIFYVPINLYFNAVAIANYRLDFSKLLPDDEFFQSQTLWTKNGNFYFDRLHKILSPRALKPSVDFSFSIQLLTCNSKKHIFDHSALLNETFTTCVRDNKAAGDLTELYRNIEFAQTILPQKRQAKGNLPLSSRNLNCFENFQKNCVKSNSEPILVGQDLFEVAHDFEQALSATEKNVLHKQPSEEQSTVFFESENDNYPTQNTVCIETENNNVDSAAQTSDADELTLKIVQELEKWKVQQMEHFLKELEHKEAEYLAGLLQEWEQERLILQQRLEARIKECEELNAKLERAHLDLKANADQKKATVDIAETIKNDIQRSYTDKFIALDMEMKRLKTEMDLKGSHLELQHREVQLEKSKLEKERTELKARITELEKYLSAVEKTHLSANELKEVINDLRVQTERYSEMEKSKNYYKEQWAKTTRELHKMKLNLLQQQETYLRENHSNNLNICLEEILTDEREALNSDRSDLKSIKEVLFVASDTSSTCDFDED